MTTRFLAAFLWTAVGAVGALFPGGVLRAENAPTVATKHTGTDGKGKALDSKNGAYGSHGAIVFKKFTQTDGKERTGMAVHSGREDDEGTEHKTYGCIRTTDAAMDNILTVHEGGDPLEYIEVQNNLTQTRTDTTSTMIRNNIFQEPNAHESPVMQAVN